MTSRRTLFKTNGAGYDSSPYNQTRPVKVARLRPDQLPGPVKVLKTRAEVEDALGEVPVIERALPYTIPVTTLPGAASTREDEDADLSATHGSGDPN